MKSIGFLKYSKNSIIFSSWEPPLFAYRAETFYLI